MNDHNLLVAGQTHVELDKVGTQFNGPVKSSKGILWSLSRGAAVGDDQRPEA